MSRIDSRSGSKVCALTGAHGYVGSALRRGLTAAGWSVVSLSRRDKLAEDEIGWSLDAPAGLGSNALREELRRRGVSAVVHAAWDLRLVRPSDLERVNVQGSLRLLDDARAAGVSRFVFISTISAFAEAESYYGKTKLAVEHAVTAQGGVVIRPGLVYGERPGGMFGALKTQASRAAIIPLLGNGRYAQYLVHEDDLAAAVVSGVSMKAAPPRPVTVAHPDPWPLRSLMQRLAQSQASKPRFVYLPWPLVYHGLKLAEAVGLKPSFRSDSVIGLVRHNRRPELNASLLGVAPRPFTDQGHERRLRNSG
jgi:nucleoside-diphosphate-sugar epimerase